MKHRAASASTRPLPALRGQRVLVLGCGESGLAMARWVARLQPALLRIADTRATPPNLDVLHTTVPEAEIVCDANDAALLADVDLLLVSPGIPPVNGLVAAARGRGLPVFSEIDLFMQAVTACMPRPRVIAITGSNGKTTTTALTAHLCRCAGVSATAAGNISPSALDALMAALDTGKQPDVWVLELSSFQLEYTHTLAADAATVLNVSEDHLDWHGSLADYAAAKARILSGAAVMVLNRDDPQVAMMARPERPCIGFSTIAADAAGDFGLLAREGSVSLARNGVALFPLAAFPLVGVHNAANALAALALCAAIGLQPEHVAPGLASFSGLPHRVARVAGRHGVDFIDDSKGTNVGATLAAMSGLGRKVAVILGGDGKGQDFTPLRAAVAAHARAVALIGRDAGLIAAVLSGLAVPVRSCASMAEAVCWCAGQAQAGDAVLLSPACASLDMYRNYAHRADDFVAAVHALEGAQP